MNGAARVFLRFSPAIRAALAIAVPSAITISACRKAEPEELVNGRQEASGGSFAIDGTGGEPDPGSGGATGDGGASNAGGTTETSPDASAGGGSNGSGDGGPANPGPLDCVVPEIPTGVAFSKEAFLEQAADCAIGRYCLFSLEAKTLLAATSDFAAQQSIAKRDAVRAAWKAAMQSWQEAEQFRFGPAASSTHPGGADLRDIIYSWPAAARCKIDEQTLNRFFTSRNFSGTPSQSLVSGRSLAALEYLAFYERPDNGCNAFSSVNAPAGWPSLSVAEIGARRAAYAKVIAGDVELHATRLLEAWSASGGNFRQTWVTAGPGNATYATQQKALNSLNDGFFYLENDVKDLKVALPAGISMDCPSDNCPDSAESLYAKVSTSNIEQNVLGFRRLFQGCGDGFEGLGFEDWLRSEEVNRGDLADEILAAVGRIDTALAALNEPIDIAVVTSPAKVDALHKAIKDVTDVLKGEFVSALNLELPTASEGDND